jgi:uncharacterized membrane protein
MRNVDSASNAYLSIDSYEGNARKVDAPECAATYAAWEPGSNGFNKSCIERNRMDKIPPNLYRRRLSTSKVQDIARIGLGLMLTTAGISHLTFARDEFKAQVPPWVPLDPDAVVLQSGVVEVALGTALLSLPQQKSLLGRVAAAFFICIFPGNVSQYTERRNAFGLDTDGKRFARLFFQPVLIGWALWSTGALQRSSDSSGSQN